jgi:hypothetical protein
MKIEVFQEIFVIFSSITFNENLYSGSQAAPRIKTDRRKQYTDVICKHSQQRAWLGANKCPGGEHNRCSQKPI